MHGTNTQGSGEPHCTELLMWLLDTYLVTCFGRESGATYILGNVNKFVSAIMKNNIIGSQMVMADLTTYCQLPDSHKFGSI